MARARPVRAPTPDQLTLDDWADMLNPSPTVQNKPRREGADADASAGVAGKREELRTTSARATVGGAVRHHLVATELLETPGALLTRTHLRELGLERRAVDAVFRTLAVVALPGYSRPMIRVRDYLELLEYCTFRDDRVRPMARAS